MTAENRSAILAQIDELENIGRILTLVDRNKPNTLLIPINLPGKKKARNAGLFSINGAG
jgi:hypothetical protein